MNDAFEHPGHAGTALTTCKFKVTIRCNFKTGRPLWIIETAHVTLRNIFHWPPKAKF